MDTTTDKKVCKIEDARLIGYTKRTRSGSEQIFYTGDDERDFDRYHAEGGGSINSVEMHDKADTIRLQPHKKNYYAMLLDGEWWWVDGCNKCNGREQNSWTYMGQCEKHDVCVTCATPHHMVKGSVWGGRNGWQCQSCHDAEHLAEKEAALAAMPEEHNEYDYHGTDEITCPYCAYEFSDSWECADADNDNRECPRCDNTFKVTAVRSLTFDCDRIEK